MPSEEFMTKVLTTGRADEPADEFDVDLELEPVVEPEAEGDPGDEQPPELEEEEEEAPSEVTEEPDEDGDRQPEEEDDDQREDEDGPEAPTAHEDEFYLGTYRTKEDAEAGLLAGQQHISRQAAEMHEMRQQLAELTGYVQGAVQSRQQPEGDFDEWAEEHIQGGNAWGGAEEALDAALQSGDPVYVDAYIEHWKETDPFEAARFRTMVDNQIAMAQQAAQTAYQPPPLQETLNSAWLEVAESDPDLKEPEIAKGVGTVLKNNPALKAAALSGDPELVRSAIAIARDGYKIQASRTGSTGTPRRVKSSDAERLQQDKLAATVTTGDSTPERGESTPEVPAELQGMMSAIERGEGGFPKLRQ
jgi:hypothetical protein